MIAARKPLELRHARAPVFAARHLVTDCHRFPPRRVNPNANNREFIDHRLAAFLGWRPERRNRDGLRAQRRAPGRACLARRHRVRVRARAIPIGESAELDARANVTATRSANADRFGQLSTLARRFAALANIARRRSGVKIRVALEDRQRVRSAKLERHGRQPWRLVDGAMPNCLRPGPTLRVRRARIATSSAACVGTRILASIRNVLGWRALTIVADVCTDAVVDGFAGAVTAGVETLVAIILRPRAPAILINFTRDVRIDATAPVRDTAQDNPQQRTAREKQTEFGLHEPRVTHSKP